MTELGAVIKESGATVESEKLPVFTGYPVEVKQLFKELLCNAVKFKKEGVLPYIRIIGHKVSGTVELTIIDNGKGMETVKRQDKLFVPFYKVSAQHEGGVGLALCKKIAELHRGSISAHCEEGKGCTFNIVLKETSATKEQ